MNNVKRFPVPPSALVVTLVSRKLVGTQANSELVALVVSFCCLVSAILDSDMPVLVLEGGHTFGHTSMESMPDSKPEEDTNRLERE